MGTVKRSYQFVRTFIKKLLDEVMVMELKGKSHGLWVLAKLAVQLEGRLQQVGVLWVWHIWDTAGKVQTHSLIGILRGERSFKKHKDNTLIPAAQCDQQKTNQKIINTKI